ncbi:hypothetical protein D3C83_25320 [compost metagenome]
MPSRPSGATMPSLTFFASPTWFSCEWFIAPGWNAVIWLSSRSVVMKACAVKVFDMRRTCCCGSFSFFKRSSYGM